MKTNSHFIVKDNQHFDSSDTITLKLLLKASGGISSDASGLYIDNNINRTKATDRFILTATDVSNGYLDLSNVPHTNEHLFVIYNGLVLDEGIANDFRINLARITFESGFPLEVGDKVIVKYKY